MQAIVIIVEILILLVLNKYLYAILVSNIGNEYISAFASVCIMLILYYAWLKLKKRFRNK